jgi:serine/threonine protein kinase/tetratricopeptide (TPR) repeat protein
VNSSATHPSVGRSLSAELAHRVEAFEVLLEIHPEADLAPHLPATTHPLYHAVLGELIRIDLERAWVNGRQKRLADYASRFPAVLSNPALLAAVAFEEYRQRLRAGERATPDEYRHLYGVNTSGWEELGPELAEGEGVDPEELARTNVVPARANPDEDAPTAAVPVAPPTDQERTAPKGRRDRERVISEAEEFSFLRETAAALPEVGTEFVGFHLVGELGRGAFGRVYLARQGDLAGRLVALKVASGLGAESNTLAQLQHPNIVPIYSYHKAGPFQAVCMPYLGGTTIAEVVKHLSDRPEVPSSGKELRSTLTRGKLDTAPVSTSRGFAPGLAPGSAPGSATAGSPPAGGAGASAEPAPEPAEGPEGWARLEGLPYVDAVLALGGQVADGLAHAHARGILHRDLKPANVLLTDDGRPMLLDFNLAEDTKLRGTAEWAMIGGTLPYMAPEHMAAFRSASGVLDARCDLYGLGVILFELLTGRHPFPMRRGPARETVPLMLADRATLPALRALNPAVSPGVESIILKCLAPDPVQRYQHAADLREDIERHLSSRPLKFARDLSLKERIRKWGRRHPRLASSGTVAVAAALLLALVCGGAVYARERTRDIEARGRLADHQTAFRDVQTFLDDQKRSRTRLDESLEKLRTVLAGYGVPEDGDGQAWRSAPHLRYLSASDRERVTGDIGEVFFLMAQVALLQAKAATDEHERSAHLERAAKWNELAEQYGRTRLPRAVLEQRSDLAELRKEDAEAARLRHEAEAVPPESARDLYLVGSQHTRQGRHRQSLPYLERATRLDPENFSAWFLRGLAHRALEQDELAAMCFGACVSLRPEYAPAWMNRGFALGRLRLLDQARDDFDEAIKLDPKLTEVYVLRADLREATGDLDGAIRDYTAAIETGTATARVYFKRATAKFYKNDLAGAKADREAGYKITPADELSWVARSENRDRFENDPKGALEDVEEALKLNPWSVAALQNKAAILSERLNRPADALVALNRAVEFHPDYTPARAGRGVLLARAGKRAEALRDAKDSLRLDTRPPNLYQVGCIYALGAKTHPEDKREALTLLWGALKTGFALDIVDTDTDLDALRNDKDFKDLVKDAKALQALRVEKK